MSEVKRYGQSIYLYLCVSGELCVIFLPLQVVVSQPGSYDISVFSYSKLQSCFKITAYFVSFTSFCSNEQDPVVQSIVSLTISLRHKFVKQISAKVTNTLLFFVEKL